MTLKPNIKNSSDLPPLIEFVFSRAYHRCPLALIFGEFGLQVNN